MWPTEALRSLVHSVHGFTRLVLQVLQGVTVICPHCGKEFRRSRVLTKREHRLMACLGEGMSFREIAKELGNREAAARVAAYRIYRMLGVHNRIQALRVYEKQAKEV